MTPETPQPTVRLSLRTQILLVLIIVFALIVLMASGAIG
jgi:hypothetical protein